VSEQAFNALRRGEAILLPTDTVYGLAALPFRAPPVERLYRLKCRPPGQAIALLAADVEMLFELVPELDTRARALARALLPGQLTLVLPNAARRFPWLTGGGDTIGVRVPELPDAAAAVVSGAGALAATSANLSGGSDPATLEEVPAELRDACGAEINAGRLPGTPSTVVDLTGEEPRVLREGAVPAAEVGERVRGALA
jgi:L-threonylcarbamoyladenylate synthase